ncbi:hypothetical protein [Geodermatophilus sp. SYSU D01176]
MHTYLDPGLEAELAYRREVLRQLGHGSRTRRRRWPSRWTRRGS